MNGEATTTTATPVLWAWWVAIIGYAQDGVCVEAASGPEALAIARTHERLVAADPAALGFWRLPYPAEPRHRPADAPGTNCPSFCWQPLKCLGRLSCPRPHACDD